MTDPSVYEKHDSFVAMRVHEPAMDMSQRLAALLERLPSLGLPARDEDLVRAACLEALGRSARDSHFTIQPYVMAEMARLQDDDLPRYLKYRYRYEMFPGRQELDDFPPCLQVEPTSICNYRCTFCYQTDAGFTRRESGHMGLMALDTFKRVVDEAQGRCEAITLASRGEPLLAPAVIEMLNYAAGKFLALKVNTNAWYLDEAHAHAILQAGVSTLVISADAAAEPTYSQFRVGGKLDRIMRNVEQFHDIRAIQYPKARTITRVSGVKVPGTPNLDEMEAVWGRLVDQVAFVEYNPWENVYDQPHHALTTPCSDLWRRMFVWWDGRVNPCDVDYRSTLLTGRLAEQSLSEIWRSDTYMALRRRHVAGERPQCEPCGRCVLV